jgi:hypothetical protein
MNAEQLRDLRAALLVELYRTHPRGRSAGSLQRLLHGELGCSADEVSAQLAFWQGTKHVMCAEADAFAPGLPPIWFFTAVGMLHAERTKLV